MDNYELNLATILNVRAKFLSSYLIAYKVTGLE